MHLDQEQIQRLIHGELAPSLSGFARDHLTACSDCRAGVTAAEREEAVVFEQLRQLDHPVPAPSARSAIARARSGAGSWRRWAAAIALVLGAAGVTYAIPGLPVRGWLTALLSAVAGREEPVAAPGAPAPRSDAVTSGVVVDPGDRFAIVFAARADGSVHIVLTEDRAVVARALGGAAAFTSDVDRLTIDGYVAGAAFEIRIPRSAPHVEILSDNRRLFLSQRSRVTTAVPAGADGSYIVPFTAPRP